MPESNAIHSGTSTDRGYDRSDLKQRVVRHIANTGMLTDDMPLAAFIDTEGARDTIRTLHNAFPDNFQHTFAAKANSMRSALALVRECGMGCEVASRGELLQALKAGFEAQQIVYDEPAKTRSTIEYTLQSGVNLNIDNFDEFELVREMRGDSYQSRIGFRINPQVGAGSIGAMSTATGTSKFGVALDDSNNRELLLACYNDHPWLTSIHTHIGSQGCTLELMVSGIRKVVDLAKEINERSGEQRIRVIDIGGGLPVNFESEEITPTFADYSSRLQHAVPELFSGEFIAKTEFGRSVYAKNGFIVSRVEYVKESGGRRIAITHAGAQTATRTTFMPDLWAIRISAFDSDGRPKTGSEVEQDVAGPCCFAGDIIAHKRTLPKLEAGDFVMLHDTGAYYFSNPFFYNSLPATAVYGASYDGDSIDLGVWRRQQTLEEMMATVG